MKLSRIMLTLFVGSLLVMFCGPGCRSAPPALQSDSLSSVEVHASEPFAAARAISEVFRSAGYIPLPLGANDDLRLAFEKESTITDTVLFGGFSGKVWERVRLRIQVIGPGIQIVHCDGFRVVDHGDSRFEEETKTSMRRGTYRELLQRVKANLESTGK
jgi:hypothetical protein